MSASAVILLFASAWPMQPRAYPFSRVIHAFAGIALATDHNAPNTASSEPADLYNRLQRSICATHSGR